MNSLNVVVTGGNGFVGSHLVDFLIEKQLNIKCIVRKSSNLKWLKNKPVEFFNCGLNDVKELENCFKNANYIFHIAGTVKAKNQEEFDYGNVALTNNVLTAALKANNLKKIVVTSSLAAVGPSLVNSPHNEGVKLNPVSAYGISKKKQEELVNSFKKKLPIITVRPPVVYGERDTDVLEFFKIVNKGVIPIIGTSPKYLSTIYVKDLVRGFYELAISEKQGEPYFLVGESEMDWQFFGNEVAKALNKKTRAIKIPIFAIKLLALFGELTNMLTNNQAPMNMNKYKETVQDAWTCSGSKALADIGFKPQFDLQDSLISTISWYKENGYI